jgi:DNA-binding FadR family transcriptional regulator
MGLETTPVDYTRWIDRHRSVCDAIEEQDAPKAKQEMLTLLDASTRHVNATT